MEVFDVVVIGGGPAGMAAALSAADSFDCEAPGMERESPGYAIDQKPGRAVNASNKLLTSKSLSQTAATGVPRVLLIERAPTLGGILNQCAHSGFGLSYFGEELTGREYARRFVERIGASGVETLTDTMVLDIDNDGVLTLSGKKTGFARIKAKAVVLASGCRERPIGALSVAGTRPAGVLTAGAAQKMINLGGYDIGERFVILGSGDVGMIVARELAQRGKEVIAVVEKEDKCGGLARNRVNCLERFGIPLITRATVSRVHGSGRISGVTITPFGKGQEQGAETVSRNPDNRGSDRKPQFIECDTLITSVGLIPERELLDSFADNLPDWLFLCGNACYVHDVVDDVTVESERAGRFAAEYALRGGEKRIIGNEQLSMDNGRRTAGDANSKKETPGGAEVCLGCPKSCKAILTPEGWQGLACGRSDLVKGANDTRVPK